MTLTQKVELGERSYAIHIGPGALQALGLRSKEAGFGTKALIVTDEAVAAHYLAQTEAILRANDFDVTSLAVPSGEASKSHAELIRIYDAALAAGLERSSWIVALGGGVVGDLAGYAAATYLRGIRFVQVPTTLLAMVDSAVGGKTGINVPQGKNLIGAFHQPALVIADTDTLLTLPVREFNAGVAEVIKYGVIADPDILTALADGDAASLLADKARLAKLVERSCAIKADVVRQDEQEGGLRAILNFGHTLGHAVEQVAGYGTYLHGEAIAIGMIFAARLSERIKGFSPNDTQKLAEILQRYGLPTAFPDLAWSLLLDAMKRDKKKKSGVVGFVLASALGQVEYGCPVPDDVLADTWAAGGV